MGRKAIRHPSTPLPNPHPGGPRPRNRGTVSGAGTAYASFPVGTVVAPRVGTKKTRRPAGGSLSRNSRGPWAIEPRYGGLGNDLRAGKGLPPGIILVHLIRKPPRRPARGLETHGTRALGPVIGDQSSATQTPMVSEATWKRSARFHRGCICAQSASTLIRIVEFCIAEERGLQRKVISAATASVSMIVRAANRAARSGPKS